MPSLQKPPPPWAQLIYTSADSASGGNGGWGIKERSPNTTDLMAAELLKGVSTRLIETEPPPNFPSEDELYIRPRRLLFRLVDGQLALWHAASAGPDATGRPGNVFTHAAMLAVPEASLRPIEYWRSDSWLTPFRPAPVNAARLGELRPGTMVTRQSTLEFIDEGEREYAVEWLLAAVTWADKNGRSVALATDSPDEAAGWLGVVCFLTAPGLAQRISWVTYERADDVQATAERGVTIICVPREDLPMLLESRPEDLLVLDPDWALEVPRENELWEARGGQTFSTDPGWTGAFLDLIALKPEQRLQVLAEMDGIVAGLEAFDVAQLPLYWPLAMALLANSEAVVNNRDYVLSECLTQAPALILANPAFRSMVEEFDERDAMGADAESVPPALSDAIMYYKAERYVEGKWRNGQHWHDLSPDHAKRLRAEKAQQIRGALGLGLEGADGTDAQVLAAAKLGSFVLKFQLEPALAVPGETGALGQLLEKVRCRLAAGLYVAPDEREDLDTSLLAIVLHANASPPLEQAAAVTHPAPGNP